MDSDTLEKTEAAIRNLPRPKAWGQSDGYLLGWSAAVRAALKALKDLA